MSGAPPLSLGARSRARTASKSIPPCATPQLEKAARAGFKDLARAAPRHRLRLGADYRRDGLGLALNIQGLRRWVATDILRAWSSRRTRQPRLNQRSLLASARTTIGCSSALRSSYHLLPTARGPFGVTGRHPLYLALAYGFVTFTALLVVILLWFSWQENRRRRKLLQSKRST